MDQDYLQDLNDAQREAVIHSEGPCMVIAGAGSGKTRVLTCRIAYLIKEKKVDAFNILSLTFTNKAAGEMRERIEEVVGTEARSVWMGTFHSVFARILRAEATRLGYPSNFTIYDTDDSKTLIKNIVKEMNLDDKVYKPNVVFNRISGAKNRLITWQEYANNPAYLADDEAAMKPEMGKIYRTYAERCFKSGAMDFDDLLLNTNILFRDHVDVLNKYQQRFQYVLVDEFQDTNISQYLIVKKLAAVRQNIAVVGDDAQSIYAFRGADIQNILNFEKDYPDARLVKLEQNYRSTSNIVNAANSVIFKNKAQLKKNVWTANGEGDKIHVFKATTDSEEAKVIATSIFEDKLNKQWKNSDFAVLYRTNSQSRVLEEAFRRTNIKYKIVGGLSFYQRREIKDILSYLKFTVNHSDEASFRRVINLPKRGIGLTTVDKIFVEAYEKGYGLWEGLGHASSFLSGRASAAVNDFVTLIKSFGIQAEQKNAYEASKYIAQHSGLIKELYADKTIEGLSRYENVQELLNAIKEYVDNEENEDKSLGAFLQEVALITDIDNESADDNDKVTLMTIHSSKGLEFKSVYVAGLEEELFPSLMMINSREDLEEERRLFYVAITRAKNKLSLSYALSRYRFGTLKNCDPSRFLEDIDTSYLQVNPSKSGHNSHTSSNHRYEGNYTKNLVSHVRTKPRKTLNQNTAHNPSPGFKASDTSGLKEGMKVEHPKFGFGKVVEMELNGMNKKAKVNFEDFGEKTLLLSFAKLRILN